MDVSKSNKKNHISKADQCETNSKDIISSSNYCMGSLRLRETCSKDYFETLCLWEMSFKCEVIIPRIDKACAWFLLPCEGKQYIHLTYSDNSTLSLQIIH